MSPNSNQDRHGAGERLKALGLTLEGAVLFHWIVLHHSASPDGKSYDWPGIRTYHMSYRYNGNIITKEDYDKLRAAGQTLDALLSPENDAFSLTWPPLENHRLSCLGVQSAIPGDLPCREF